MAAPLITLNDGCKMPALGLGTWQAGPGEVAQAVKDAIDVGYRHFDCAMLYGNEAEIGEGVRAKIADGTVTRDELFITSKLWNTYRRKEVIIPTCKKSLENFGLEYLDLYLIHWPIAFKQGEEHFPYDSNGRFITEDIDYVETWKEIEKCHDLGLTKSIGVSNFNTQQMKRILDNARIKPVTNQVEAHPYLNQKKLNAFCLENGVILTAYSPLGAPNAIPMRPGSPLILLDETLKALAQKYGKSVAQIALRYLVQCEMVPVPKSTNKKRMIENIDIFNFQISDQDMSVIDALNKNARAYPHTEADHDPNYPFHIE